MKYFAPDASYMRPTMAVPIEFYRVLERRAEQINELDKQHGQSYNTNQYIHDLIEYKVKELEPWVWAEWKLKRLTQQAEWRKETVNPNTVSYLKNLIASKPVSKQ